MNESALQPAHQRHHDRGRRGGQAAGYAAADSVQALPLVSTFWGCAGLLPQTHTLPMPTPRLLKRTRQSSLCRSAPRMHVSVQTSMSHTGQYLGSVANGYIHFNTLAL